MASQEKREFDKYLKFLTSKAVQVVIQSHDGTRMNIGSNPNGTDWFNIVLNDNRDIVSELKQNVDPPFPQDGRPIKVEITAETTEGEVMLVEVWQIILDSRKRDVTVSVSHSLYPRLSLLLKSVMATSRCIPSYQLSRKNDDLKFKYTLSTGEPSSVDGLKKVKLGECVGPCGTVSILLYYRTQFTITERVSPCVLGSVDPLSLTGSSRQTSVNEEDSLPLMIPTIMSTPTTTATNSSSSSATNTAPFSSFLPKPAQRMPSSEKNTPSEMGSLFPSSSRQNSDDTSISVSRDHHRDSDNLNDDFVVLDMKPAFTSDDLSNHEASELLMLCTDPPFLDMFYEGGMDVSAACVYLDTNQQQQKQPTP